MIADPFLLVRHLRLVEWSDSVSLMDIKAVYKLLTSFAGSLGKAVLTS